jgi:hypothetical protein
MSAMGVFVGIAVVLFSSAWVAHWVHHYPGDKHDR